MNRDRGYSCSSEGRPPGSHLVRKLLLVRILLLIRITVIEKVLIMIIIVIMIVIIIIIVVIPIIMTARLVLIDLQLPGQGEATIMTTGYLYDYDIIL